MNLVKNRNLHPHLRDEEARVVENAIRLAIDSIINVLYGVNSARAHEYQRMVADRDKEIQRLECRLKEMQVSRRHPCTCGMRGKAQTSGEPVKSEPSGYEPDLIDTEMTTGQQECEMSISLGLYGRPLSQASCQSQESAPPSSPSRMGLDQSCTSHSSLSSGASEATPSSLVIKEEPCEVDTGSVKWEMSEERYGEPVESADSPCEEQVSSRVKNKLVKRERKVRVKADADPDWHHISGGDLRYKKKNVPTSELSEEAQRLKRAAWRAASRRYYARKIARQQANASRSMTFPHITDSQFAQPVSYVDRRRRSLISELPDESQTLQREAWRAASRRYYARKTSHLQSEPTQYAHLLQGSEDSLGGGGPGTSSGGIMCS